jgi:hypothetical protein
MRRSLAITTVLVASLLSGCQTIGDVTGMGPAPSTPAPSQTPLVAPDSDRTPAPARASGSISADRLLQAWGEPQLRRKDIGSELWQFGNGKSSCAILVYLYPSGGGAMAVTRTEAVPGGSDEASVSACARLNGLPSLVPVS